MRAVARVIVASGLTLVGCEFTLFLASGQAFTEQLVVDRAECAECDSVFRSFVPMHSVRVIQRVIVRAACGVGARSVQDACGVLCVSDC